jgi:chaperone modulatory protein CbpM
MIGLDILLRNVAGLKEAELRGWIEQDWVRPSGLREAPMFQEVDVARVRLILELTHDLAMDDETVPVVLSLLDQLYRERARMRRLCDALSRTAPPDIIERLRAILDQN